MDIIAYPNFTDFSGDMLSLKHGHTDCHLGQDKILKCDLNVTAPCPGRHMTMPCLNVHSLLIEILPGPLLRLS